MDSDISKSEQVEQTAVAWLMRQQSGEWTDADQVRLDAWLDADRAHRIQYLRATYAWEQSGRMKALGAGVPPGVVPPRGAWGDRRFLGGSAAEADAGTEHEVPVVSQTPLPVSDERAEPASARPRRRLQLLAAAALVLLAGATYITYANLLPGTRYSTSIGGMDNVTLADGSHITLNTNTRVRVTLSEHERRISLDRGEAFFEVAKDKTRPFIVYVGDKRVMAVGTKFSVRRNHNDVQVVVTEGRVKLATVPTRSDETNDGLAARLADVVADGIGRQRAKAISIPPVAFLDAGAIARTSHSEVLVRSDATLEAEKLLSWRVGYVSFDNVPLAEAVAEFNRYNARQIVIEDPALTKVLIGGNFRSNNTDAFLDLLQNGFPIVVEQRGDEVMLRPR